MLSNKSLFSLITPTGIKIKTGSSDSKLIKLLITINIDGDLFDINDSASQLLSGFVVDNLLHVPYSLPTAHISKAKVQSQLQQIHMDLAKSHALSEFKKFVAMGINHNLSPPETPERNSYAERANRTILDKAWSILLNSRLPDAYWAEAVNTATLLCNMAFGSKAYVAVPKSKRSWKLGKTGEQGILAGYENEATVYQILRLCDKKLVRTRHTVFDESTFPTLTNSSPASVFDKLDDYFTEEVSLPEAELPEPSTSYHPVQLS
ncbi:hypothetical protein PCASD_09434 [Puccinia coronata f. sp. avenae]|uniref:Integrase catalytic domain-containing protein n=1 Tax=Puccinia coronata f. sp. avenae TaxID=200324 RepID=A0A2N5UHP8_9BASI|nr:hypothetical protein PCASD_09434 [Puccinia coronata f. sp. avenae]